MDIVLAKTFLTVLSTKSFVTAAESLLVSQSAISVRIQKLEDLVGKQLLNRSKTGVEPTVYGEQFEEYARAFLSLWDEAVYQTSLPDGFDGSLSLACQDSLWPELCAAWVLEIGENLPTTAVNFSIKEQEALTRSLVRGAIDIAVVYSPEIRPGLEVEQILEDQLVLVTGAQDYSKVDMNNYVYCDWGAEFGITHARWFPGIKPPQFGLQIGTSIPKFLIANKTSAYMPYRIADDYVASGDLNFVEGAERFPFPAFAVWVKNQNQERINIALDLLRVAADNAPWIDTFD